MKSQTAPALPGRPRAFDADVALERAMHVLWAKRYEGASIHYPSVQAWALALADADLLASALPNIFAVIVRFTKAGTTHS
jgi:hypothetical protein